MKKIEWRKDGMKQIINTGHKEFDRQLVCASTGNVIGGGQLSFYIRAYTNTECNGYTFPPGHLQKVDLDYFREMPTYVRCGIEELTHDRSLILYQFYHLGKEGQKIVHGYILTTGHDEGYTLVKFWVTGRTYKSGLVIDGVLPYVCNISED